VVWQVAIMMPYFETAHSVDFRDANLTSIHGNQYNIYNSTEDRALASLKPAMRSGYDVPRCTEGTRENVFKEIDIWLEDFGKTIRFKFQSPARLFGNYLVQKPPVTSCGSAAVLAQENQQLPLLWSPI
jgi:hypothetical protein